jgi:MoaA/NifB/PqqE/SkfB family radical SAM enzyme
MQADTFDATLRDLERLNLIDSRSVLELYHWGETFLHPDLENIIRIINDHGLRYSISTNASVVPRIDEVLVKNLISVRFSMCGFSQQSYDRIHKFNFDSIRENITTIVSRLRSVGYKKYIEICFHVYRFNTNEIQECQRFANDLGISLWFADAYLGDWWQFQAFVQGTLPDEKRREILADLFIDEKRLRSAPKRWRCPQWDFLIIDERGQAARCVLPNNHPLYSLGSFDDGLTKRLLNRPNSPICKECLKSGIAYRLHHTEFKGDPSMLKWLLRVAMKNWRTLWIMMKTGWKAGQRF